LERPKKIIITDPYAFEKSLIERVIYSPEIKHLKDDLEKKKHQIDYRYHEALKLLVDAERKSKFWMIVALVSIIGIVFRAIFL
jgi:hypothetical protein